MYMLQAYTVIEHVETIFINIRKINNENIQLYYHLK